MEADLLQYFGLDILDYWRGNISDRRMALLIRNLPLESRTFIVQNEEPHWTRQDHLLATIADRLAFLDWHFICANWDTENGGDPPPPPDLLPRPGVEASHEDAHLTAPVANLRPEQGRVVHDPTQIASAMSAFLGQSGMPDQPEDHTVRLVDKIWE